jgi:branched-chain amino acid transport system substrate-binding protein
MDGSIKFSGISRFNSGLMFTHQKGRGIDMKKLLIFAVMIGLFCMGGPMDGLAQPIRFGAVINLTGPASTWGQFHAKGLTDYIRHVNEVKGGIGGRKVDLTVVDHAFKPPEGVRLVKKFSEEKVDMLATWDAGTSIMIKPIIQEHRIPTIVFSTFQGILAPPIDYIYLPFGSYVLDSHAVLEYIKAIHKGKDAPKVGLLTYNTTFGKSIHDPSKDYAGKHGINIVGIEEFPMPTIDISTEMLRLKGRGAEYVFVQLLPEAVIRALTAADRTDFKGPIFGTWTITDADFFKLGKGLVRDRLFMSFCGALPGDKVWGMQLIDDLMKKYKSVERFDTSYWEGVVIGMIMERAAHRASGLFGKINAETINKAMETFKNEDFGGLVPNITYSKDNHEGSFQTRIVQVHEDATYTPMTNFFTPAKKELKVIRAPKK